MSTVISFNPAKAFDSVDDQRIEMGLNMIAFFCASVYAQQMLGIVHKLVKG